MARSEYGLYHAGPITLRLLHALHLLFLAYFLLLYHFISELGISLLIFLFLLPFLNNLIH